eukprot:jgi/Picsp_1/4032/NSC_01544-R1_mosc domain-containing protein
MDGLVRDREYMVVRADTGRFVSQRNHPKMAMISVRISSAKNNSAGNCSGSCHVTLDAPGMPQIALPNQAQDTQGAPQTSIVDVSVWDWKGKALELSKEASGWISEYLETPAKIVRYSGDFLMMAEGVDHHPQDDDSACRRFVDTKWAPPGNEIAFPDGFPFLLTTQKSLDDLNARINQGIGMERFRTNFCIGGPDKPWQEDSWRRVKLGSRAVFNILKPCTRCKIPSIDPNSGEEGEEPRKILSEMRKGDIIGYTNPSFFRQSVFFGVNMTLCTQNDNDTTVCVGDAVSIIDSVEHGEFMMRPATDIMQFRDQHRVSYIEEQGKMLRRLFCVAPPEAEDWVTSRSAMMQNEALYSKTRALDIIESDADYHFTGLRLRQQVLDPNSMKRLHRARLPVEESARVTEIMGKISAIARSRQEIKQKCSEMHIELQKVQEEARIAEFAKEKAEALATARGQALMKCQNALQDAEEQQVQLSELLRSALEQLGVHSPEKKESIERKITSPVVAQHVLGNSGSSAAKVDNRQKRTHSMTPPACMLLHAEQDHRSPASAQAVTPLSGFTVYSNVLSQDISPHLYKAPPRTPMTDSYESKPDEVGPRTAERLARMVLPHLDANQINSLVQSSMTNSESHSLREIHGKVAGESPVSQVEQTVQHHSSSTGDVEDGDHREHVHHSKMETTSEENDKALETRKSRFQLSEHHKDCSQQLKWSNSEGDDLIKAGSLQPLQKSIGEHEDKLPNGELERKRRAAERVMRKLNAKLPPAQRRDDLVELSSY